MEQLDKSWQYARDVVAGRVVAGVLVTQACQRALGDLKESEENPESTWVFSAPAANHFLQFCTYIKHVKGELAGKSFDLEPWQLFLFSQVFGWRRRSNKNERRFREILIEVARKNGKSFICSAIALYELLFGDAGAEVYSVATKTDQAKIVWDSAGEMAKKMDTRLSGKLSQTVSAIKCDERFSSFKPLARDSKSLDGLNPSLVIIDEAGAIEDRNIIGVMTSAVGARLSPLIIYITTAYFSKVTSYYEKRSYAESILKGRLSDDRIFAMIYTLDEQDDWRDPTVWLKANPNLNVSINTDYLQSQVNQADAVIAQRPGVLVKHFNLWQSSSSAWIDVKHWENSVGQVVREGPCYLGMDLAQTRDLCAVTRVWDNGNGQYSVDFMTWLPQSAVENAPPHIRPMYLQAIESGVLKITEGVTTDYREIQSFIEQTCKQHSVHSICADPYNATQLVNELEDKGLPVLMVRQGISHLSAPSKETEVWITEERLKHDGNPFLLWQLSNCAVYTDLNANIKVRKGDDQNLKIDSIIALIMAVSAAAGNSNKPETFNFGFIDL
jgi:phage terminase large subunit-like protein|tara:strand:+ start:469 stop:2133 length:1665 start_codon:yes stop_codon:yes gene_type:complete